MRFLIAGVLFLIAALTLGFINTATYEALSSWGVSDTIDTICSVPFNLAMFLGCWTVGLLALGLGIAALCDRRLRRLAHFQRRATAL